MKNTILLIAIFVATNYIYAQNIIDPPCVSSSFTDGSVFDRSYGDTHFIEGWNYGGAGVELDDALGMNYYLPSLSACSSGSLKKVNMR